MGGVGGCCGGWLWLWWLDVVVVVGCGCGGGRLIDVAAVGDVVAMGACVWFVWVTWPVT